MEPKRGLFAGGGTTARLPRQLAFPAAMEFLLTAEAFPAERALELGLVNEIVPTEDLMATAASWARRILANAPLAVQATKESVIRGLNGTLADAYVIEQELSSEIFATDDAKEGPLAFKEKRAPNWQATVAGPGTSEGRSRVHRPPDAVHHRCGAADVAPVG